MRNEKKMIDEQVTAPIILFTYARPEHTQKTLDALAKNFLAQSSDLYIFCDGPKNEKAVQNNLAVQNIIKKEAQMGRFHSVILSISEKNRGLARSVVGGVTEVIHKHGCCIVVEDDLITSPYFLTYMNECLKEYKDDDRMWAVSGFTYPLKSLKNCTSDIYLSYRACSHGWATWQDRWELVDWEVSDYPKLRKNLIKRYRFNRGGNDLYRMLRHQMRGERDSWAIRFCYSQFVNDKYCIYPKVSMVHNIGFDGSGTHCSDMGEEVKHVELQSIQSMNINDPVLDKKILREFKAQYRVSFKEAVQWLMKKILK